MSKTPSSQFHKPFDLWWGWKLVFILFIPLVAGSCKGLLTSTDGDQLADRSFLTGKPCEAPCWQGLTLDNSSEQEILDVLNKLPFIKASNIYTYTVNWLGDDKAIAIHYSCTHPVVDNCGELRVSDDKLKLLRQTMGYDLTLETVVTKLGPPDYIDYGPIDVDIGGCVLSLNWPEKSMIVFVYNYKSDSLCREIRAGGKIPPETLVTDLMYLVEEGFGPLPGGCCRRIPWPGFAEP